MPSRTAFARSGLALWTVVLSLAACKEGGVSQKPPAGSPASHVSPAATPTAAPSASAMAALDLREANVLDVGYQRVGQASYRFDVTLIHDDEGEAPSYADLWVVEDGNGRLLGERVLLHAHGSQPFTRSEVIEIPASVETVVIRGHDQLHGFGGQAIELDLASGETRFVQDADEP